MSSLRSRRMARNHRRMQKPARLNLVALMDIFTILVLFLMVNNGDVEVLQPDRNIELPESVSEQRPVETITIKVSPQAISVQGKAVTTPQEAFVEGEEGIPALAEELAHFARLAGPLEEEQQAQGRPVIIMGDQSMPYELLTGIMKTCAAEDFRDISLAVNSVAEPALGEAEVLEGGT